MDFDTAKFGANAEVRTSVRAYCGRQAPKGRVGFPANSRQDLAAAIVLYFFEL